MKIKRFNENFDWDFDNFDEEEFEYENFPQFPTYRETKPGVYDDNPEVANMDDFYFIYKLNENDIKKYLNKWFKGRLIKYKNKIIDDSLITIKKVDNETKQHLYDEIYNPVSLIIMNNESSYDMKCTIRSIDDSTYGVWFNNNSYKKLKTIRKELMNWIDDNSTLNGEKFLKECVNLGADVDSIDYD